LSLVPSVEVEIDGTTLTLAEDFNAYRAFDKATDGDILNTSYDILAEGSAEEVVAWIWALLLRHHPEITIEAVGSMMTATTQAAFYEKARELQRKALEAAGVEVKGDDQGEDNPSDGSSSGPSDGTT
jgi:hypothetical protein